MLGQDERVSNAGRPTAPRFSAEVHGSKFREAMQSASLRYHRQRYDEISELYHRSAQITLG